MQYLTVGDVLRIHVSVTGEQDPTFDFGLLESAVMRPQQTVAGQDAYPNLHLKAGAMMHSLIRNHPFLDGNKRTGVASMYVLYGLNGYGLIADDGDLVALALDIAEGIVDVDNISKRLANWVTAIRFEEGE